MTANKALPLIAILALVAIVAWSFLGGGGETSGTSPEEPRPAPGPSVGPKPADPLADILNAKPDVPPIPDKGTKGWSEAKLAATDVARKMDDAFRGLRNVTCNATVVGNTPAGKIHNASLPTFIRDDKSFNVSFLRLQNGVPTTAIAKADGTSVVVQQESGYSAPRKVGSPAERDVERLVAEWPRQFPTDVFDGLVEGGGLWSDLVGGWAAGTQGYELSIEERITPYKGRDVLNYRLLAHRKLPGSDRVETMELVVDGQLFLPVTIRGRSWNEEGKEYNYQWSAEWHNQQKLDPKLFVIK